MLHHYSVCSFLRGLNLYPLRNTFWSFFQPRNCSADDSSSTLITTKKSSVSIDEANMNESQSELEFLVQIGRRLLSELFLPIVPITTRSNTLFNTVLTHPHLPSALSNHQLSTWSPIRAPVQFSHKYLE